MIKIYTTFMLAILYSWIIAIIGAFYQNDFNWITFIYTTIFGGVFTYFPALLLYQLSYDYILKFFYKNKYDMNKYLIGGCFYALLVTLIFSFFDTHLIKFNLELIKGYLILFIILVPLLYLNYNQ